MEERKILAVMLLVALVVLITGTIVSFDRLGVYSNSLTGAVTGQADLNVTEEVTISLPNSTINFGNGIVDSNSSFAIVDSRSGVNTDGGTWANLTDNITVRNDGNVGVNITIESNVTRGNESDSFICQGDSSCGSAFNNATGDELEFAVIWADNEGGSCSLHLESSAQSFMNPEGSTGSSLKGCGCLKSGASEDELIASLRVGIPDDADGQKSATITISATSSSETC